jgi:hypothetical protein
MIPSIRKAERLEVWQTRNLAELFHSCRLAMHPEVYPDRKRYFMSGVNIQGHWGAVVVQNEGGRLNQVRPREVTSAQVVTGIPGRRPTTCTLVA